MPVHSELSSSRAKTLQIKNHSPPKEVSGFFKKYLSVAVLPVWAAALDTQLKLASLFLASPH